MDFTRDLAEALYNSEEKLPVDFNDAWQWLEYSRKDSAKAAFLQCGFEKGIDFNLQTNLEVRLEGERQVSREVEQIKMTAECFKQWGMMTGTNKGREIRQYFLDCERKMKEFVAEKAIRDLSVSVDTTVQIKSDPHSNEFRPDFIEEIRQIRLELERIKNDVLIIDPELARYLMEVIRVQTMLKFQIELPIKITSIATKESALTSRVHIPPSFKEIDNFVQQEILGKEELIIQNLVARFSEKYESDLSARTIQSRIHHSLVKHEWRLQRSERIDRGLQGRIRSSIYVKVGN